MLSEKGQLVLQAGIKLIAFIFCYHKKNLLSRKITVAKNNGLD